VKQIIGAIGLWSVARNNVFRPDHRKNKVDYSYGAIATISIVH